MISCAFNIMGETLEASPYATAYRKGDMFVIEFINNIFVPFLIVENSDYYSFFVMGTRVFKLHSIYSPIRVSIKHLQVIGGIDFFIDVEGSHYIGSAILGLNVELGAFRFLESQLIRWASARGVEAPAGCVRTAKGEVIERDCTLINRVSSLVIHPYNGFNFPILVTDEGIRVLDIDVACSSYMLFVRLYERSVEYARFRIAVVWPNNLRVFDNMEWTIDGVRCGDSFLSGGSIAKLLVLGG